MASRPWWETFAKALSILALCGGCSTAPIEKSAVIADSPLSTQQEERERQLLEEDDRHKRQAAEEQMFADRISDLLKLPTSNRLFLDDLRRNPDIDTLVNIGKPAIPYLVKSAPQTIIAVMVLGEFGVDAFVAGPKLKEIAETHVEKMRLEALIALSKIGYDPAWTYATLKVWIDRKPSIDSREKDRLIYSLARFDPQLFDVLLTLKTLIRRNEAAEPLYALTAFGILGVDAEPEIPFLIGLASRKERIGNRSKYIDLIPGQASKALKQIAAAYKTANSDLVRERVGIQARRLTQGADMSESCEDDCWWDALSILHLIGEPAVPQLAELLDEPRGAIRSAIVLDLIGDPAVPELIRFAKARTPDVSEVLDKVLKARKSTSVHFLINLSLSMYGVAVAPVLPSGNNFSTDPSLEDVLNTTDYFDTASWPNVFRAFALLHLVPDKAFKLLADFTSLAKQPNGRRFATLLLSHHPQEAIDVLPVLLMMLNDLDSIVAINAASALKAAGKPAIPILARALAERGDASMWLQKLQIRAITLLGEIGDPDALPLLERRFKGPDQGTKEIELSAINQIRSRNNLPQFIPSKEHR